MNIVFDRLDFEWFSLRLIEGVDGYPTYAVYFKSHPLNSFNFTVAELESFGAFARNTADQYAEILKSHNLRNK